MIFECSCFKYIGPSQSPIKDMNGLLGFTQCRRVFTIKITVFVFFIEPKCCQRAKRSDTPGFKGIPFLSEFGFALEILVWIFKVGNFLNYMKRTELFMDMQVWINQ